MIKSFQFLFVLSMVIGFPLTHAMACECMEPTGKSGQQSYAEADIVVNATLIDPSSGWGSTSGLVRVHVENIIKGDDIPEIISANYNSNAAVCGHEFKNGETGIYALYDTRSIGLKNAANRGYGFRMMVSCDQDNVRYHLGQINKKTKTDKDNQLNKEIK